MVNVLPRNIDQDDFGNGWQRPYASWRILAYRDGWKGAWDAIKAAWKKDQRLQVERDLTFSFYAKPIDKESYYQWGAMMEVGPPNNKK